MPENKMKKGFTDENSTFTHDPHGEAKSMVSWIAKNTAAYGMFAGICLTNESPRRGETLVTRKILMAVAAITLGK
jgi:GDPmannose 4,6-dehydratase